MVLRRHSRAPLAVIALAAMGALAATSSVARAAPPTEAEIADARERFAAGRKLEDAGRWGEALTVFQRVAEVRTTPQVRFHIALCMENVGLWTQALDGYQRAVSEAGSSAPDVVQEANDHMRKLSTSMPTVTLVAPGAAAGDEIHLDRRRVMIDDGPLPIRADPGPHVDEVRRRGAVIARQYFALAPKATLRVELRVGDVAPEVAEPVATPAPPVAPAPPAIVSAPSPVVQTAPDTGRVQRALGWSAVGVGAASAVLTGVFIGLRADARNRLEIVCPTLTRCPQSVSSIVAEGKRDATLVNVFGVLGGIASAAGIAILVTAPPRPARAPAAISALTLRVGPGALSFTGAF